MSQDQQSKQSIQVTIRVRPPTQKQLNEDSRFCVKVQKQSQVLTLSHNNQSKRFLFDSICDSNQNQEDIFMKVGIHSTKRCLQGYNCSIFAYGQTGAGKTFTMMGINYQDSTSYQKRGLIPRTLEYLFESMEKDSVEYRTQYLTKCTFLQIYNQQIIDLLNKSNTNLQVREDLKKGVYVEGIQEEIISRSQEAMDILKKGSKGRHVGSTHYNETSSRSHSVFTMLVESKAMRNGIINMKSRRFHFIDLAGSERTKLSNGQRLKEGCSINKSLSVLGMVINSLVQTTEGKSRHINYRDSKLTFLLKDALGGNSKTHLIANISPNASSYNETLSTLTFARRVKLIKLNKVSINQDSSGNLQSLKCEIKRLKQEIIELKSNKNLKQLQIETQISDTIQQQQQANKPGKEESAVKRTKEKDLEKVILKNEIKLNLERLLQQYITESIQKETKFEVQLLKKEEKLLYLSQGLKQYNKNEIHLRMIINLYEEKFKRLKQLEGTLNQMIGQLSNQLCTDPEKSDIIIYMKSERDLLYKSLHEYKQLLNESPFIRNLMKQHNLISSQQKQQNQSLTFQLIANLNFLKELKSKLDSNIQERIELNQLLQNYSITNKDDDISPKKRKQLERQFEIKEKQFVDKIQQLSLQVAYVKGTMQETQILLKESVDKQLTLEQQIAIRDDKIEVLSKQMKQLEERQSLKYNNLSKIIQQKEESEEQLNEKLNLKNIQILNLNEQVSNKINEIQHISNKCKKYDEEIQMHKNTQLELNNRIIENQKKYQQALKLMNQQHQSNKIQLIHKQDILFQKNKQIASKLNDITLTNEQLQTKIAELELLFKQQRQTSRQNQNKYKQLEYKYEELNQTKYNIVEENTNLKNQIHNKNQKIYEHLSSIDKLNTYIESERTIYKNRQLELKQLLMKKEMSDSELQNKVNHLKIELISYSEKMQQSQIENQNLLNASNEQNNILKSKIREMQYQLETRNKQIWRLSQTMQHMRQNQKQYDRQIQQNVKQNQEIKNKLKDDGQKIRKLNNEIQKYKSKEQQLNRSISQLVKQYDQLKQMHSKTLRVYQQSNKKLNEAHKQLLLKQKSIEKIKQTHDKERYELLQQLESQKERASTNESNIKKIFEECIATKQKCIIDLRNHNSNKQAEITNLNHKNDENKKKIKNLEEIAKEYSDKLNQKEENIQKINQQIELLKDEIEHMKNIFEQKIQERQNNYNEFIDKKNQELDRSEIQYKKMCQKYDRQNTIINQLEQQLENSIHLNILISTMEITANNNDQNSKMKLNKNQIINEIRKIVKQNGFKNDTIANLKKQNLEYNINIEQFKKEVETLSTQNKTITNNFENVVKKLNFQIQNQKKENGNQKVLFDSTIHELKQQNKDLQDQIDDIQLQLAEKINGESEREDLLTSRIQNIKHENINLQEKIRELYNNESQLQNKVNKIQIKQINNKRYINQLQNQKKQFSTKLHQLLQDNKEKNLRIIELHREKQRLTKDNQYTVNEYKHKIIEKVKDMEKLEQLMTNSKKQEIQSLTQDYKMNFNKLTKSNDDLQKQLQLKIDQLSQHKQQYSKLFEEKQIIQNKFKELYQDYNSFKEINSQHLKEAEKYLNRIKLQDSKLQELQKLYYQETESNINLKKLIANLEKQKAYLENELDQKEQAYKKLVTKLSKQSREEHKKNITISEFNIQNEKRNAITSIKYAEIIEKLKQEVTQSKKTIDQTQKTIKKLKNDIVVKEQSYRNVTQKTQQYYKIQDQKFNELKINYHKLQTQNQLLNKDKEQVADLKSQIQQLQQTINFYKIYQQKSETRISELEQSLQILNQQIHVLKQNAQKQPREPYSISIDNQDKKLQYINKIKQENNLLKKQKSVLTEKLQMEMQQKKNLKNIIQKNNYQKRGLKDPQNRNSVMLLDSLATNNQMNLKIQLDRKLVQIKYLQQGFAELCVLLGIKKLEFKNKGETTKKLIVTAVQELLRELNEHKNKLKDKQNQLDNKIVKMELLNKQYQSLKNRISDVRYLKDNLPTVLAKQQNIYKKIPSKMQNHTHLKNMMEQYKNENDEFRDQPKIKLRDQSRRAKERIN